MFFEEPELVQLELNCRGTIDVEQPQNFGTTGNNNDNNASESEEPIEDSSVK